PDDQSRRQWERVLTEPAISRCRAARWHRWRRQMRCGCPPCHDPACLRWRSWPSREGGEFGIGEGLQFRIDGCPRQAVGVVAERGEAHTEDNFQRLLIVIACRAKGG